MTIARFGHGAVIRARDEEALLFQNHVYVRVDGTPADHGFAPHREGMTYEIPVRRLAGEPTRKAKRQ